MEETPYHVFRPIPWIYSKDVRATLNYLVNILSFETWFEPEPDPNVAGVRLGDLQLRILLNVEFLDAIAPLSVEKRPMTHVVMQGIEALYRKHRQNEADIVREIGNRPWGDREYTVELPGGQLLTFSEDIVE